MSKRKSKAGHPTDYKPEYCQMLIDHMSQGYSFETFGAVADCHRDTLYEWSKVHEEFSDAKKKAFLKCQMFWERLGINFILDTTERDGRTSTTQSLNTGVWVFNMKNRFKWADKVEVSGNDVKPILFAYDPTRPIPEKERG